MTGIPNVQYIPVNILRCWFLEVVLEALVLRVRVLEVVFEVMVLRMVSLEVVLEVFAAVRLQQL